MQYRTDRERKYIGRISANKEKERKEKIDPEQFQEKSKFLKVTERKRENKKEL